MRTGNKEKEIKREEEKKEGRRISKDRKINKKWRILINVIEEVGWAIWNEDTKGDEERELTFRRRW